MLTSFGGVSSTTFCFFFFFLKMVYVLPPLVMVIGFDKSTMFSKLIVLFLPKLNLLGLNVKNFLACKILSLMNFGPFLDFLLVLRSFQIPFSSLRVTFSYFVKTEISFCECFGPTDLLRSTGEMSNTLSTSDSFSDWINFETENSDPSSYILEFR